MGNIGMILTDEMYYGFRLSGLSHCFLSNDLASTRRAITSLKGDKNTSLVIIEKKLKDALDEKEKVELERLEYPFFFEFNKEEKQAYSMEIEHLIKRLGISVNES